MYPSIRLFRLPSILAAVASVTHAVRLPIHRSMDDLHPRAVAGNSSASIATFQNLWYFVNMTVGGQVYSTIIDTGSADMWIYANVSNTTPTGVNASLGYATGGVEGVIYEAPLSFAGYHVPSQLFIQVQNVSGLASNPRDEGWTAVVGLGPPESSDVYKAMGNITAALPMMNQIFKQNAMAQNYITLHLPRAYDPDTSAIGTMMISEPIPGHESILNQTKLPVPILSATQLTTQQQHWTTLTDVAGVIGPNGQSINVTGNSTASAGTGQLVAVFDSGYTFSQVPKAITDALYAGVPGANYSESDGFWIVPCTQELNITFVFGGQKIFVHPLDVTMSVTPDIPINSSTICIGTFQTIEPTAASGDYDMILGTNFLRNVDLLLDYGNFSLETSTDQVAPYIQLLATTNATEAHNDFINVRINNSSNSTSTSTPSNSKSAATISAPIRGIGYWLYVCAGLAVTVIFSSEGLLP
ncbi:hypothetical protein FRB95_010563 [Tulasnella sp. JGI-2019a]|nr:hypothetical protein FRB95_010563 [Tulasnella sp. JGI-2019a]